MNGVNITITREVICESNERVKTINKFYWEQATNISMNYF
jgi:hypothetical protein